MFNPYPSCLRVCGIPSAISVLIGDLFQQLVILSLALAMPCVHAQTISLLGRAIQNIDYIGQIVCLCMPHIHNNSSFITGFPQKHTNLGSWREPFSPKIHVLHINTVHVYCTTSADLIKKRQVVNKTVTEVATCTYWYMKTQ